MKASADHLSYLQKPFAPEIQLPHLSPRDLARLIKYGSWFAALIEGLITPTTEAQTHFIASCGGNAEPTTDDERLWRYYKSEIAFDSLFARMKNLNHEERCREMEQLKASGSERAASWLFQFNSLEGVEWMIRRHCPPNSYKHARRFVESLAAAGHPPAAQWLKKEGPWTDLPSIGRSQGSSWEKGRTYFSGEIYGLDR